LARHQPQPGGQAAGVVEHVRILTDGEHSAHLVELGRVRRSTIRLRRRWIAWASAASFLFDCTNGLTNCGAIRRTS
jgi:hypothetical protein